MPRNPESAFRPPDDPGLPHFGRLLDPDAMRGVFQGAVDAHAPGQIRVAECTVSRFRYRPETRAIALFRLALEDRETGASTGQWACGTLYAGGKARKAYKRLIAGDGQPAGVNGFATAAFSFVVGMDLLVQWYPADRHLPDIAAIIAGAHREFTRPLADAHGLDPAVLASPAIQSMRYRPGESGTLKISVTGAPAVFVKVYREFDAEAVLRLWGALGEAAEASGGAFAIPPIGGAVARRNALAILPAAGLPLEDLLAGDADPAWLARDADPAWLARDADPAWLAGRAADAILALRRSGAVLAEQRDVEGSMLRFRRAADFLTWGEPGLGPRIGRIGAAIRQRFRQTVLRPAHLDLKLDHLFLDRAGLVTFIDVDSAGMADPMLDPAQLIARLDLMPPPDAGFASRAAAFRTAFLDRMRAEYPPDSLGNFAPAYALGAIKVALFHFQHLEPGWRKSVDSILGRIEAELGDPAS